jgi:catechol 2,3-dioxygenase-like lactoylglutathione lyase family enzyme
MKITVTSIFVNDQDKAFKFYTYVLGFLPKNDVPLGTYRWLTVVSPDAPDGVELLLEPNANPAALTYQQALYEQGIPATAFNVDDMKAEYERLIALGVKFKTQPDYNADVIAAAFDDTCGNYIQLYQMKK